VVVLLGRSVSIVRLRTKATEFGLVVLLTSVWEATVQISARTLVVLAIVLCGFLIPSSQIPRKYQ
jgi:hypothetical protein